jgi:hypothetical protein
VSPASEAPARPFGFGAGLGLCLMLGALVLGCCRAAPGGARQPLPGPGKEGLPWIAVEQTGGFAGFRNALALQTDGSWLARDRVRNQQRSGRFSTGEVDSLRALLEALPPDVWGSYPSKVPDDFNYAVTVRRGLLVLRLDGGGTALPRSWEQPLRILDRPFAELRMRGPN